jgi:beta-lactamase class A
MVWRIKNKKGQLMKNKKRGRKVLLFTLGMVSIALFTFSVLAREKNAEDNAHQKFENLEASFESHLGVYAIDTSNDEVLAYREEERFAYASTFKALAGALLLKDYTWEELNEKVMIHPEDLVEYSPITEKYVGIGLSLKEMMVAAMQHSDNTAGNFLLKGLDQPQGFQERLRSLGDEVTNASRFETALNEATPGDIRDTSTPKAFGNNLRKLALEAHLPKDKQEFFKEVMLGNTTGKNLIRAGIPEHVEVGDKTGAAYYGTRNDIALLYPENRAPIVLVIFSKKDNQDAQYQDALIAQAAKIVSDYYKL